MRRSYGQTISRVGLSHTETTPTGLHMRTHPITLALVLVATSLQAQRYHSQRYREPVPGDSTCRAIWDQYGRSMSGDPEAVYCEIREVGVRATPSQINIEGESRAGVMVQGENRRDMRLRLVIQAQERTVERAKALAQEVQLAESPTLHVTGISGRGDDELHFVSATILVTTPEQANINARVDYAPLSVENVRGRMDLFTEHGPLELNNVGGDVRARVEYGPISVALDGLKWDGTQLDAEAEYGPVTLSVPRQFNADLEIGADHGPMDIDFPLTLTHFNGQSIDTKLGTGGPKVRAVARYGPMSLKINR
jgi:hypothetical protein